MPTLLLFMSLSGVTRRFASASGDAAVGVFTSTVDSVKGAGQKVGVLRRLPCICQRHEVDLGQLLGHMRAPVKGWEHDGSTTQARVGGPS